MDTNTYFIIDFDSTFITSETLEELAQITLKDNPDKDNIYKKICAITNLGMEGTLSFEESLKKRLQLIKATKKDIQKVIVLLKKKITPSIKRNKKFFKKNKNNIYIVSGAFKECVAPIVTAYGIPKSHVLANTFIFDKKGNVIGVDTNNPLAGKNGKYIAVRSLDIQGKCYSIGDGYTDYQIKKFGAAEYFIAFTENVTRMAVIQKTDHIAKNFDDFLCIYKNLNKKHLNVDLQQSSVIH